jgi:hypothetical protein
VHRLRQRCGELFRDEIAHTVASPDEIEDEVRHSEGVERMRHSFRVTFDRFSSLLNRKRFAEHTE